MAENLARPYTHDEPAGLVTEPRRVPGQARLLFPYRSPFHRTVRLVGLAALIGSALGLLAGAAGMPINGPSMGGALILSILLIGFTLRPSLRRPRF